MDRIIPKPKGTFIIKVTNSQNKSWQGQLIWADEKKTIRFRSVLELFELIEEAARSTKLIELSESKASGQ